MPVNNPLGASSSLYPLDVGEEALPRLVVTASPTLATGQLRLAYFTARKTEAITQIRMTTGGTAAAATPTLCRMGVYSEATNGDLTLVAACANDTTLFASASAAYTRTLTSTFNKVQGQRYAAAWIVVSGVTVPNIVGVGLTSAGDSASSPRLAGALTGQTDLPASIASASVGLSSAVLQTIFLP